MFIVVIAPVDLLLNATIENITTRRNGNDGHYVDQGESSPDVEQIKATWDGTKQTRPRPQQ